MHKKKILFIVAHPDDEVYGAGGTISKMCRNNEVSLMVFCKGDRPTDDMNSQDDIGYKRTEALSKSCELLGITALVHLDYSDVKMDKMDFLEIVKKIKDVINIVKPDEIYTHDMVDVHRDHKIVSEAVLVACRRFMIKRLCTFVMRGSSEWSFGQFGDYRPNLFIPISKTDHDNKIKAIQLYESELSDYPHPRSIEMIGSRDSVTGSIIGVEMAEAFKIIKQVGEYE